jgi:hypothetical protein
MNTVGVVDLKALLGQLVAQSRVLYNILRDPTVVADANTKKELTDALFHIQRAIAIVAPIEEVHVNINN